MIRRRRRTGFNTRVRKVVGWSFNQLQIQHNVFQGNPEARSWPTIGGFGVATTPQVYSGLFRIMSNWFNTRETMLALMARFMTAAQCSANQALWAQGGCRWDFDVTNVTNARTRFKVYWCTLKSADSGGTPGSYLASAAVPFSNAASAGYSSFPPVATDNAPWSPYWRFFDQAVRQPQSGDPRLVASNIDGLRALNILTGEGTGTSTVVYRAPIPSAWSEVIYNAGGVTNPWEAIPNVISATPDQDTLWGERMSYTFPFLNRKLRVRCVGKGRLGPYASRSFSFKSKLPRELRFEPFRSDNMLNFIKDVSGFFMLKAVSEPSVTFTALGASGGVTGTGQFGATRPCFVYPDFNRLPAQLRLRVRQTYRVRAATDGEPSYMFVFGGTPTGGNTTGPSIFNGIEGFFEDGSATAGRPESSVAPAAPAAYLWSTPTGPAFSMTATVQPQM